MAAGEVPAAAIAHREGAAGAPVQFVYFDDYGCDDCARFNHDAIEHVRHDWVERGRARLTLVDLAWKRGSVDGAAAAWCADEQGKYWAMHSILFDRQAVWLRVVDMPTRIREYAAELGLDSARFRRCTENGSHRVRLAAGEDASRTFGVRGTPAFVVNGRLFYGSQEWSWVEQVLLAYERGDPAGAPAPPLKIPTKKVVDSARLKELTDSIARTRRSIAP